MIKELMLIIWSKAKYLLQKIHNRFIRDSLIIIIMLIMANFFLSFVLRYTDTQNAVRDLKSGNYSLANTEFIAPQPFITIEEWKQKFNSAAVSYYSSNFEEALSNYTDLREALQQENNTYNLCIVNYNIATITEKIAEKYATSVDNPEFLRTSASKYLDAFMLRNDINVKCHDVLSDEKNTEDISFYDVNDSLIDSNHMQYNTLIKAAYEIDGKVILNEIDEKLNIQTTTTNKEEEDSKLKTLLQNRETSEQDAQKAKDLIKEKSEEKIVKPW